MSDSFDKTLDGARKAMTEWTEAIWKSLNEEKTLRMQLEAKVNDLQRRLDISDADRARKAEEKAKRTRIEDENRERSFVERARQKRVDAGLAAFIRRNTLDNCTV
jgi:hypothetical protein